MEFLGVTGMEHFEGLELLGVHYRVTIVNEPRKTYEVILGISGGVSLAGDWEGRQWFVRGNEDIREVSAPAAAAGGGPAAPTSEPVAPSPTPPGAAKPLAVAEPFGINQSLTSIRSTIRREPVNASIEERAQQFREAYARVRTEIGKVVVGHADVVEGVLTSLFVGGHVLLEGVPGLGKTLLVRTLGDVLQLEFKRIQFTPDLMPADIIGTNVIATDERGNRSFSFQPGPIFTQICLADEINRATPKTQSALLEAMQEHSVTVGGVVHRLSEPFFVLATQTRSIKRGRIHFQRRSLTAFCSSSSFPIRIGRRLPPFSIARPVPSSPRRCR